MKILLTGCTAPQSSKKTNERFPSFVSLFKNSLEQLGHEVHLERPNFYYSTQDLDMYDLIYVGLVSPSSFQANYVYGAFSVANKAKDLGKLRFILDNPDIQKLRSTVGNFYNNTDDFFKPLYERRPWYVEAMSQTNKEEIINFCGYLYDEQWPTTVVPSMPWFSKETISSVIPNLSEDSIIPICYDSFILDSSLDSVDPVAGEYWVADSYKSAWTRKILHNLTIAAVPVRQGNYEDLATVMSRMRNSVGTLVSTHKNNQPWWSISISQSLSLGVPVVTDWRYTSNLGAEWAYLPSTIEEMSPIERLETAQAQKDFYRESIPTQVEALEKTELALDKYSQLLVR